MLGYIVLIYLIIGLIGFPLYIKISDIVENNALKKSGIKEQFEKQAKQIIDNHSTIIRQFKLFISEFDVYTKRIQNSDIELKLFCLKQIIEFEHYLDSMHYSNKKHYNDNKRWKDTIEAIWN